MQLNLLIVFLCCYETQTKHCLLYSFFGQFIASGPPETGMMGATLEIQRAQQMEALEQQLMRQQVITIKLFNLFYFYLLSMKVHEFLTYVALYCTNNCDFLVEFVRRDV